MSSLTSIIGPRGCAASRDLLAAHYSDAGGEDILSEGQCALIRRAAMLELQLEMLETKFANNEGAASAKDLDLYARTAGNLRRLIETLGLHHGRKAREVNELDDEVLRIYQEELTRADDAEMEATP